MVAHKSADGNAGIWKFHRYLRSIQLPMYLTALLPPSNISKIIADLQREFFVRYATAAALYIPPHIPLLFSEAAPAKPPRPLPFQQFPFETGGLVRLEEHEYLEVLPQEQIEELTRIPKAGPSPPYYPTRTGIPITLHQTATLKRNLEVPAPLRWRSSEMVCYELLPRSGEAWWKHVEYRMLWSCKIREFRQSL